MREILKLTILIPCNSLIMNNLNFHFRHKLKGKKGYFYKLF